MLNKIDLSRIDLNLLVLFETVFEEGHVGRAAERLNLSPSAVSHGLGRLRRLLNDPLFIRTPKGVVANQRAAALAPAIREALHRVRAVIAEAEPFDPATSSRRMVIGAPDGIAAVFLQPLLSKMNSVAPGIDVSVRHLLPVAGETDRARAWREAFESLEAGTLEVAVIPSAFGPARFAKRHLYDEDFVLAMRLNHPFLSRPTLEDYCASRHLVVSESGDPRGFIDEVLAERGASRRVALTVPNFMFACATVSETDYICAIPRHFASLYASVLGIGVAEPPIPIGKFELCAFVPTASLADKGIDWFLTQICEATETARTRT